MTSSDPFEKRVKRRVLGRPQVFYAATPPGMERLCAVELAGMGLTPETESPDKGGVLFSGRIPDVYRANLHLRLANRVLMRLDEFTAANFRHLAKKTAAFPWELYLHAGAPIRIHVAARRSRLMHTAAVAEHVQSGLAERLARVSADAGPCPPDAVFQRIYVRGEEDRWTISLDSSGELLHKRGVKILGGAAPVRETIAAAVLALAGYRPGDPLVDPMCGAGTFSLEAAMMAGRVPAGWFRDFAFRGWPCFRPARWNNIRREAEKEFIQVHRPVVFASDIHPARCLALENSFQAHPLFLDAAQVRTGDFFALRPSDLDIPQDRVPDGLIVLNPPYGRRLGTKSLVPALIADIGRKLKQDFQGWRIALMVPDARLVRQMPFPLTPHPLFHGGLHVTLLTGRIR